MPLKRLQSIISIIKPKLIISIVKDSKSLDRLNFNGEVIEYDKIPDNVLDETRLNTIRRKAIDTDPVYTIFTSGSTGEPKGVLINHRSVIDLIEQFTETFDFSSDSVFGNQAPLDYDGSVKDIYSTLKNGASMHIIPRTNFSFPINLFKYLEERKINTIIWATSALRIIANLKVLDEKKSTYLGKILFTGEVMPNKVLNYFRKHYPSALFVNLYGPTEITCNCSYFIVDRPFDDEEVLPIGFPFKNTDIFVLNKENQLVTEDEVGEICVRGTSLALGYYNNPAETEKILLQ